MPAQFHSNRANRSWLRSIPVLLLILSLACSALPAGLPTPTPSPEVQGAPAAGQPSPTAPFPTPARPSEPLPPQIVEAVPSPQAEIGLERPITLYFNQAMDRASVESALQIEPDLAGAFTWQNDAALTFIPEQALPPNSQLTLQLNPAARSAEGLALQQPISLTYRTAGYLRLAQQLPEPGAQAVAPDSAVVAAFNRPVVPLGADPAGLPPAFSLEPPVNGRGEWVNTSAYIFYPEPALPGDATVTVSLTPGLVSADGSPLESPASWSFTTAAPQVLRVQPEPGSAGIGLTTPITITFNQPMDPLSVQNAFSLSGPDGASLAGEVSWNEKGSALTFQPQAPYERGATYTLRLSGAARAAGGAPLGQDLAAAFAAAPPLAVSAVSPVFGALHDPNAPLRLTFSAPLAPQDFDARLTISPTVADLSSYYDDFEQTLNVFGTFQPLTDYTLVVSPELTDPWGGSLGAPFLLNFTTLAFQPNLTIVYPDNVLFLTPQDAALTAQATNLTAVPMTLGSVPLSDFIAMLGPEGYGIRENYTPVDAVSWTQPVSAPPDRNVPVQLFLRPDGQPLAPGMYLLRLNLGNIYGGPYLLVVSEQQLTLKLGSTDTLVWAVNLNTGAPVASAPVAVLDDAGQPLVEGITDANGLFYSAIAPEDDPYRTFYALLGAPGEPNFSLALSHWSQGIDAHAFQIPTDIQPPRLKLYLYSDRPIYRPGQTMYFKVIARQAFNGRYAPPDRSLIPFSLFDPFGREVATFDLPLSAFGTGHGEFAIPQAMAPGIYTLQNQESLRDVLQIKIAAYRKPEINLQVALTPQEAQLGAALQGTVNAQYFFGAPAGGVPAQWVLYARTVPYQPPVSGYVFGPLDTSWLAAFNFPTRPSDLGAVVASGQARTSPDGTFQLDLSADPGDFIEPGMAARFTLEVTLQDESGLPVSGRAAALLHPGPYYAGLKADAWSGRAGELAEFEVQTMDWGGVPVGDKAMVAEFSQVAWERQTDLSPRFGQPVLTPVYTLIASTNFTTGADGLARLAFTPPDPGVYQVTVRSEGVQTDLLYWVGGAGQAVWPEIPNARLRLTGDKESYLPGETAQVFVPNPFPEATPALLTLERGAILEYRLVTLQPGANTLSVELSAEHAPNVFVSLTLLDPRARDFRQGYLELLVEPQPFILDINVLSDPAQAGPGDEVTIEILARDSTGAPVEGEFSLAVVDLAVLALAEPNSPDLAPAFYGPQPLGVRTGLSLAAYAGRNLDLPGGLGGGGDEMQIPGVVRADFPDTAYWTAQIVTDAAGRAVVNVTLPDNLTTWQIEARGVTVDTRVGQERAQIVASKDLLIRPITPRFFVTGDRSVLAAVVQNNTPDELSVEVGLQAAGFELDDPAAASQTVAVPAGGRARVEWPGQVAGLNEVSPIFSARAAAPNGETLEDAARPPLGNLPVLRWTAPQNFETAGVLDEESQVQELISLPRSYRPTDGTLEVELAPSLAAGMLTALEALETFPYACTEQTLSRFLPNLEAYRALQTFGLEYPELQARLDRTLDEGLTRLLVLQNEDGGWSWWPGNAPSDPYLSAYIVFGLSRARQAGATINEAALQRALDFLSANRPDPNSLNETWRLDQQAFIQFALDTAGGAADQQMQQTLFDQRALLNPWAQALLALTYEAGSAEAATLLSDVQTAAIRSASGAHWERIDASPGEAGAPFAEQNMVNDVTNSAIVLYALAQRDPGAPLVADAARYLMARRGLNGAWDSTYASAWSLLALTEVMRGVGELGGDFAYSATLNGAPLVSGQAGGPDSLNPVGAQVSIFSLGFDFPNRLLIEREPGPGRLYYRAGLRLSRPVEDVAPYEAGLSIRRTYNLRSAECAAGGCPPIQTAAAGQQVVVHLTLTAPTDMTHLIIEDYIPAGAEILDLSLLTSQQGFEPLPEGEMPPETAGYDVRRPFAGGWGQQYFSAPQIYDDHIAWAAEFLPSGTYELTYIFTLLQPGEYRALPARAWQFYFPDVQANSAGEIFTITP